MFAKKGFLRSSEGIFTLSPKVTVIGRESCDFVIQNITVDVQQAVIEYDDSEDCFVLKDLNSTHGSYINDCRIQGASVRLANGDILRFGFSNGQYEFQVTDQDAEEYQEDTSTPILEQKQLSLNWQGQHGISQVTTLPSLPPMQQRYTVSGTIPAWSQGSRPMPSLSNRLVRPQSATGYNKRQLTPTAPTLKSTSSKSSKKGSISGPTKAHSVERTYEDLKMPHSREMERILASEMGSSDYNVVHQQRLLSEDMSTSNQVVQLTQDLHRKQKEIDKLQILLDRVAENSGRLNDNMSNNALQQENSQLKSELDKTKRELQICQGLVTNLQKDVTAKENAIGKLKSDVERLNQEITEKDITIASVMTKLSKFKDCEDNECRRKELEQENETLKEKLKSTEGSLIEKTEKETVLQRLVNELTGSRQKWDEEAQSTTKNLQNLQSQIDELKSTESVLRIDLKTSVEKYENFRKKIVHIALSVPGIDSDLNQTIKDDQIVTVLKELVGYKLEQEKIRCEKQEKYELAKKEVEEIGEKIKQMKNNMEEKFSNVGEDRNSEKLSELIDSLSEVRITDDLDSIRDCVVENLRKELLYRRSIEICIIESEKDLAGLELTECFKTLIERCKEANSRQNVTDEELKEEKRKNEAAMVELTNKYEDLILEKIEESLIKERAEKQEHYEKNLKEIEERVSMEASTRKKQLEEELEKEKELNRLKYEEVEIANKILTEKAEKCDRLFEELEKAKAEIQRLVEMQRTLEVTACEQQKTLELQCQKEIDMYKQESIQHAITINSLTEELHRVEQDRKGFIDQYNKKLSNMKVKSSQILPKMKDNEKQELINTNNSEIASLERCIAGLRQENMGLKEKLREDEEIIESLRKDLVGAEAKLSDLKGELSESQKTEMDSLKVEIDRLEGETNDLRTQLSKFSCLVDEMSRDIEDHKLQNKILQNKYTEAEMILKENTTKLRDAEMLLESEKHRFTHQMNQIEQEGRHNTELANFGAECRGQRHIQIIDAQKTALNEMRMKLRTLEVATPAGQSESTGTHQMLQLKKDLAELRSKQALKESTPAGVKNLMDIPVSRRPVQNMLALTDGREKGPVVNVKADDENQAQKVKEAKEPEQNTKQMELEVNVMKNSVSDLMKCLDLSESSYASLVNQMVTLLDVGQTKTMKPFENLSMDDKYRVRAEREDVTNLVVQKVKILKERIARKEELLEGYEGDLVKLRQAECLAAKTKSQMEAVIEEMRNKGEEVELLRETLNRTKDLLNQEKRINAAIKQHKHYDPESGMPSEDTAETSAVTSQQAAKYHCPIPDVMDKEKAKENMRAEKLKRKNYEIKSLKAELYRKEKELTQATNRLHNLEKSMGIQSEKPPL